MGAHGVGLFDDDGFPNFAERILRSDDITIVAYALNAVPTEDWEYCDHITGMKALLAAELIAAHRGYPSETLPDAFQLWIENFSHDAEGLVPAARVAVNRIIRNSETRELWQGSPRFKEWLGKTLDLGVRLG